MCVGGESLGFKRGAGDFGGNARCGGNPPRGMLSEGLFQVAICVGGISESRKAREEISRV
ncbi:hypothetical protein GCM10023261_10900 [Bartonella jaculi]|uniref:Uncharacterized protein n=1 Tax=Bartonella jaculi TaxID=686226 RepID=A0ABP9N406_9HYPH